MVDTYSICKDPSATKLSISKDPDATPVILTKQPGNTRAFLTKNPGGTKVYMAKNGGGTAWTPASLSSLTAWYRADEVTGTTDITSWTDKAGSNNLVAGDGPSLNATDADINNQPSITFDGVSEYLEATGLDLDDDLSHVFLVVAPGHISTVACIIDGASVTSEALVYVIGAQYRAYSLPLAITYTATPATIDTWAVVDVWFSAGTDSAVNVDNGTPLAGSLGSIGSTGLRVGARGGTPSNFGPFDIAEIMIFNEKITGADLTSLHNYLNDRYGFSN